MIKVFGSHSERFTPDWVQLDITLEAFHPDYEVSVETVRTRHNQLINDVVALGFKPTDLKTVDYRIEPIYKFEDNVRHFTGYQTTLSLLLEFPLQQEKLNETVRGLQTSPAKPNLNIQFTLRNPDTLKNDLIVQAIRKAQVKAKTIADTLGVRLGPVEKVEELPSPQNIPFRAMAQMDQASSFVPAGILLTVNLEIEWSIEH